MPSRYDHKQEESRLEEVSRGSRFSLQGLWLGSSGPGRGRQPWARSSPLTLVCGCYSRHPRVNSPAEANKPDPGSVSRATTWVLVPPRVRGPGWARPGVQRRTDGRNGSEAPGGCTQARVPGLSLPVEVHPLDGYPRPPTGHTRRPCSELDSIIAS